MLVKTKKEKVRLKPNNHPLFSKLSIGRQIFYINRQFIELLRTNRVNFDLTPKEYEQLVNLDQQQLRRVLIIKRITIPIRKFFTNFWKAVKN